MGLLKEEGEEYTALLDSDYEDKKVDATFGDAYNENMLKSLETRKYEFAKEGDK